MKLALLFAPLVVAGTLVAADSAREQTRDVRLNPPKDLDGYFPFTPPTSRDAWEKRAERVRQQVRVAMGIWPEPEKTPLNAVVHGRIERDDYTVEKVFFESMPGFFVTGNLYRPKAPAAAGTKRAGVLCPHGHWPDGRFMDAGEATTEKAIADGGEKFLEGGRSPLQARCVQLARMGCVVFHYDMIGYADSVQITQKLAHGFAKQRPEMNTRENWGLFSPQAESHAQSVMGLQTWNSIRALDFLTSLPDVDPQRIGVTGASGGGTQTFIQAALDPRVTAAFPAVMVSTAMQGGCTCENASLLRVGTGNIELAALFAPKPMAMTAANDWTKEMETKGFPELQKTWEFLGAPKNVQLTARLEFGHNYNAPSRAAMYAWFNEHLKLGCTPAQFEERDYQRLTREEMSVWDKEHPAPERGDDFERKLLRWWHDDTQRQLAKSPEAFQKSAAPAWQAIIGRSLDEIGNVEWVADGELDRDDHVERTGELRATVLGESVRAVISEPKQAARATVLWLTAGDAAPTDEQKKPLLAAGTRIIVLNLRPPGAPATAPKVKNPRESLAYTAGYNHAVFAQRVHDVLTALQFARTSSSGKPGAVSLLAVGDAAPMALAARAVAGDAISATATGAPTFRFADVADISSVDLQPGAARYGDVPGLVALGKSRLLLTGKRDARTKLLSDARRPAGDLPLVKESDDEALPAAVTWLSQDH